MSLKQQNKIVFKTTTSTRQTRPENGQAMNRVEHLLFGTGTVIESRITESGQSVRLVHFDASETDRLILADSLKLSSLVPADSGEAPTTRKKKAAAPAKGTRRRKTASPPVEEVSDRLLVEALDDTLTSDSEDTDEIQTLEAM